MNGSNTFTFSGRLRVFVLTSSLALMAMLVTGTVSVWAQDMPGVDMEKHNPKPKPKPKPTPQKKKQQPATKKDDMEGMGMKEMPDTKGTGRMSASDPNALMVMSGNAMDIRLGASFVYENHRYYGIFLSPSRSPCQKQ